MTTTTTTTSTTTTSNAIPTTTAATIDCSNVSLTGSGGSANQILEQMKCRVQANFGPSTSNSSGVASVVDAALNDLNKIKSQL
jgi:hypothetical protein